MFCCLNIKDFLQQLNETADFEQLSHFSEVCISVPLKLKFDLLTHLTMLALKMGDITGTTPIFYSTLVGPLIQKNTLCSPTMTANMGHNTLIFLVPVKN